MAHANKTGRYVGIEFDEEFKKHHLVDYVSDTQIGDPVHKFRDAQDCAGELLLRYDSADQMNEIIANMDKYVRIKVE